MKRLRAGRSHSQGVDLEVFVDRTESGIVNFHPKFASRNAAPLDAPHGKVILHIFVDAGSVEVFVNDGERVFTDLVFPSADSRQVEFIGAAKISRLNVWKLKSVWK